MTFGDLREPAWDTAQLLVGCLSMLLHYFELLVPYL